MRRGNHISIFSKAGQLWKQQGLRGILSASAGRFYDRHKSIWFELPLDETPAVIPPRFEGRMDFDHPRRVIEFIKDRNIPGTNDPDEISSMMKRDQMLVGVLDGDNIIGFIKIGWDKVYVLDYGCDIQVCPGDFFVIDIYIGPEMRGKGAGPFLVSATSLEMKKRKFRRGVMHVRIDKEPMLRTCARTGYREIGRVNYKSILGKKIFRPHPSTLLKP
jgi:ribosomal protein S18 acetylase RimI-like enzyme